MLFLLWASLLGVLSSALAPAQEIRLDLPDARSDTHVQRVSLQTDIQTVAAGKPAWIDLRFHVATGFHINSHAPKDETLIPTDLALPASASLHALQTVFPDGAPLHLNIGAGETLSTYTGDFIVKVQVLAERGEPILVGSLRYQACDTASCFPPRTLPVRVALSAR